MQKGKLYVHVKMRHFSILQHRVSNTYEVREFRLLCFRIFEWRTYNVPSWRWCALWCKLREVPRKSFALTFPTFYFSESSRNPYYSWDDEIIRREVSWIRARDLTNITNIRNIFSMGGKIQKCAVITYCASIHICTYNIHVCQVKFLTKIIINML